MHLIIFPRSHIPFKQIRFLYLKMLYEEGFLPLLFFLLFPQAGRSSWKILMKSIQGLKARVGIGKRREYFMLSSAFSNAGPIFLVKLSGIDWLGNLRARCHTPSQ